MTGDSVSCQSWTQVTSLRSRAKAPFKPDVIQDVVGARFSSLAGNQPEPDVFCSAMVARPEISRQSADVVGAVTLIMKELEERLESCGFTDGGV